MKKVYVFCPYGLVTGGSDALHQLVYYVNQIQLIAHIVYTDISKKGKAIPKPYQIYVKDYLLRSEVEDSPDNEIIVPETRTFYLPDYPLSKKFIWWLSVNNNSDSGGVKKSESFIRKLFSNGTMKKIFSGYYTPDRIKEFLRNKPYDFAKEDLKITHLCASAYALSYVSSRTKNPAFSFVEPISLFYLKKGEYTGGTREKRILYNPKKNPSFYKSLLKKNSGLSFVPLKGYNQKQLLSLYRTSILYIDFGFFPGQERIPKEAVYNGCLVLTGTNGASFFHQDVPIPKEDKIESKKENIALIYKRIQELMDHYDEYVSSFSEYRKMVKETEGRFVESIQEIFLSSI